jgi:hypothetical protein
VTTYVPIYRHSHLEQFAACPFAFAADLACRVPSGCLGSYLCPEGEAWVREATRDTYPVPADNYVTDIGVRFHRFAHAYGIHCQRKAVRTDWSAGDAIADGIAGRNRDLRDCMTYWMQSWEYDVPTDGGSIPLVSGGFETGQAVELDANGHRVRYSWHPDYARLSADLKTIDLWDWKSGLSTDRYDPRYAPDQLLRYAWAFTRLFPTLQAANLHLQFVNPSNPLCETPLHWEADLSETAALEPLVTNPIAAIRATPEFRAEPGCWLCGFCDYAHCCPATGHVHKLLAVECDDARLALTLIEHADGLSSMLTQRRKLLRKIVNTWVEQNGPLDLGDGTEYGPTKETVAKVASTKAVLDEAASRDCDVTFAFGLKSGIGAIELAKYVGQPDPFADDDGKPWESITMGLRTGYEVRQKAEDPTEQDEYDDWDPTGPVDPTGTEAHATDGPGLQEREATDCE